MEIDIKISGEWLRYSRKISEFQAARIMAYLSKPDSDGLTASAAEISGLDKEAEVSHAPAQNFSAEVPAAGTNGSRDGRYESPRQAIAALGASTNPQKIVAIALYLGATSDNGRIVSNEEVLTGFAKAAEKTPKNIARDLKVAVADGYIFQERSQEGGAAFRLLSVTDRIAAGGFRYFKPKRRPTPKAAVGSARKPRLPVRDEVASLPLATSLEGYVDLFDTNTRSDRILWMLKYAKEHGLDGINRQEILYLSNRLGSGIDTKGFAAANVPNVKKGYVSLEKDAVYLTLRGERHMAESLVGEAGV